MEEVKLNRKQRKRLEAESRKKGGMLIKARTVSKELAKFISNLKAFKGDNDPNFESNLESIIKLHEEMKLAITNLDMAKVVQCVTAVEKLTAGFEQGEKTQ